MFSTLTISSSSEGGCDSSSRLWLVVVVLLIADETADNSTTDTKLPFATSILEEATLSVTEEEQSG